MISLAVLFQLHDGDPGMLPLLTRLALAVCPSFLLQLRSMDTSFPPEQMAFRWQCDTFQSSPAEQLKQLTAPLLPFVFPMIFAA